MIIEQSKLEALNRKFISSKVYTEQDMRYAPMYWYGNSPIALAQICSLLGKYCDKLEYDSVDFDESYEFYSSKHRSHKLEDNVSGSVILTEDGEVERVQIYTPNVEALRQLKNINVLRRGVFGVEIPVEDIGVTLEQLKASKCLTTEFKKYLKDVGVRNKFLTTASSKTANKEFEEGKVTLKRASKKSVEVICSPDLHPIIREAKGFRINPSTGILEVQVGVLMTVYNKLSAYARESGIRLDLSDFEEFIDVKVHDGTFVAEAFSSGIQIGLKIPFHPYISEMLVNVPTSSYLEEAGLWVFHNRYLNEVIEKLGDTHLGINLDELISIRDEIETRYEEQRVELLDLTRFPAIRKPWAHQIEGAKKMLDKRKILLADEMGTGKTYTTILAALSVGMKLGGPLVVVCPSALKYNWVKEIREIDKNNRISVAEGYDFYPANWMIINYDILERHAEDLINLNPKVVIFDESHKIKGVDEQGNPKSKRAFYSITLSQYTPYMFSLTGTPTPVGPIDLYNQFRLMDHPLSDDFINFGVTYCDGKPCKQGWNFTGASNTEKLYEILQDVMICNKKEDCLDLPAKLRTFMPVDVDLARYNEAVEEYMNSKDIHQAAYRMVLVGQMKKYLAYSKVPRTIEIISEVLENGDKCVVFSDYTAVIDSITKHFNDRKIPTTTITGKQSSKRKFAETEAFQSGKYQLIVCNMKAGGVGLNMNMANKLIFNDLTWLPADHFQAEDRIHRGGQTKKVEIIYTYAEGAEIDAKLANVIEERAKMSAEILHNGNHENSSISVMKGVLQYLTEVRSGKRKPGNFVVDTLEDDIMFDSDFDGLLFNDDDGDFSNDFEGLYDGLEVTDGIDSMSSHIEEPEPVKTYPCIENGVYMNPPYFLQLLSESPLVYQYSKDFGGTFLCLQIAFKPNGVLGVTMQQCSDGVTFVEIPFKAIPQVTGKFSTVDEVGTSIMQHLTKLQNYLNKRQVTQAKATALSLKNTLEKYLSR